MKRKTVVPIILAAGQGTRMKSVLAKVLHLLQGKALIEHVLSAIASITAVLVSVPRPVVVVGWRGEQVRTATGERCLYAEQQEQHGTGHAVLAAQHVVDDHYPDSEIVLVLCGDTPLIRSESLSALIERHIETDATITVLTAQADPSSDFGRIVRDDQQRVSEIVEWKVATEEQRRITEVNSAVYCFDRRWLFAELARLPRNPGSGEYYLTDLIRVASRQGRRIESIEGSEIEGMGVNTPEQLAAMEKMLGRQE